jgi:ankyrin repeat protein
MLSFYNSKKCVTLSFMRNIFILLCFIFSGIVLPAGEVPAALTQEVAVLLVKGDFEKAIEATSNNELKENLQKLLNLNKLVAKSYEAEIGNEISIYIRKKLEKGILNKIKGQILYVKVKKGSIIANWPVKVKSLPLEFRMKRIGVPGFVKSLYFGAKAFRQKNYPAAEFYFKQTDTISKPLLKAADKESKYILSLSAACRGGDLEKTEELVKKGADVNGEIIAHVKNKKTQKLEKLKSNILIETIKHQQQDIIKYLIKNGADINKSNSKGVTPLMFAIMYFPQKLEIVEFMLNHQANLKVKDKAGNTPLTGAVGAGRAAAVKLLMKHGANVNAPTRKGLTPLMLAVASNNPEMFKLLLENGADMNKRHPKGWTVFQLDRRRMHPEIRAVMDKLSPLKKPKGSGFPVFSNGGLNVLPTRK